MRFVESYFVICLHRLANAIIGGVKFNTMKVPFKQMENINNFLSACEKYGVAKTDLFQTVDLYEKQNLWQVVLCIFALGRKVSLKLEITHRANEKGHDLYPVTIDVHVLKSLRFTPAYSRSG